MLIQTTKAPTNNGKPGDVYKSHIGEYWLVITGNRLANLQTGEVYPISDVSSLTLIKDVKLTGVEV